MIDVWKGGWTHGRKDMQNDGFLEGKKEGCKEGMNPEPYLLVIRRTPTR
jgi:hypothetical protein